jgi:hypothetical protein
MHVLFVSVTQIPHFCPCLKSNAHLPYTPITPAPVKPDPSSPPATESVTAVSLPLPPDLHFSSETISRLPKPVSTGIQSSDRPSQDTRTLGSRSSMTPHSPHSPRANLDSFDVLSVSSGPDSPFIVFSEPRTPAGISHSLSREELLSASDDDLDRFSVLSSALSSDAMEVDSVIDGQSSASVSSWDGQ